jgi:hypothetical protein
MKLRELVCLRVPPSVVADYKAAKTLQYRSVIEAGGTWYYLYPEYMKAQGPFTADSEALLCESCAPFLRSRREKHSAYSRAVPPYSIAYGYDYSRLARFSLPELSAIEKLCLRTIMPYGTIVKLDGSRGHFALRGNVVAIPTPAAELCHDAVNRVTLLPRRDIEKYFTLMLIGPLDKWQRIMQLSPSEPRSLLNVYRRLLRGSTPKTTLRCSLCFISGLGCSAPLVFVHSGRESPSRLCPFET